MSEASPQPVRLFLPALRKSGLISNEALDAILARIPESIQATDLALSDEFLQQGHLTQFQVRKLLEGLWQGFIVGNYHILTPIGRGGMGTVYLAKDVRGEDGPDQPELVAIKVLPPKRAKKEARLLARFQRETTLAKRVDHPCLTRTYEAGEANGVWYLAMEYIRGATLFRYVISFGPLIVSEAARFFSQVCDGLEHAHELGLIHRDLKPSNIMVTTSLNAKIVDLGLAIAMDEDPHIDESVIGGQKHIVGTMDYVAPEQTINSSTVDHRADLYSLGCTMYFALTGQPPFPGGTGRQKIKRHRAEFPTPISQLNPDIPLEFQRIIDRLLAKEPERRYPDAKSLREALEPWVVPVSAMAGESLNTSVEDAVREIEHGHAMSSSIWEVIIDAPASQDAVGKAIQEEVKPNPAPVVIEVAPISPLAWIMISFATACILGGILVILILGGK
jgi:eukaryotic-like serine/threonine-protein kinase